MYCSTTATRTSDLLCLVEKFHLLKNGVHLEKSPFRIHTAVLLKSTNLLASVYHLKKWCQGEEIQVQEEIEGLSGGGYSPYKMTPLSRAQFLCFLLVWLAYASTYLLRKPLGVIKADLGEELGVSANVTVCLSYS